MARNVPKDTARIAHRSPLEQQSSSKQQLPIDLSQEFVLIATSRAALNDAKLLARVLQRFERPCDVPSDIAGVVVEFSGKERRWTPVGIARTSAEFRLPETIHPESSLLLQGIVFEHGWWIKAVVTGVVGQQNPSAACDGPVPGVAEPWQSILLTESADRERREEAILALGAYPVAAPALFRLLEEPDRDIVDLAHGAIAKLSFFDEPGMSDLAASHANRLTLTDRSGFSKTRQSNQASAVGGAGDLARPDRGSTNRSKDVQVLKENAEWFSLEEVAGELGGIPSEIGRWIKSGVIELVDASSAREGRICKEDLQRIERHQIAADIQRCFKDPDKFLDTRFERFGDKTPRELLAADDADLVRDLVWQVKSGAI